jgi:hypothetical protein
LTYFQLLYSILKASLIVPHGAKDMTRKDDRESMSLLKSKELKARKKLERALTEWLITIFEQKMTKTEYIT